MKLFDRKHVLYHYSNNVAVTNVVFKITFIFNFQALSELLSEVLEAVGVNPQVVNRRRNTFLHREDAGTVYEQQGGNDMTYYHFGSQSEGTTTPGMNSDIDRLTTFNDTNIMYTLSDWKKGKRNLLMVRDRTTPAQHYMLQEYRRNHNQPVTHTDRPYRVTDEQGRVFLSNRWFIDKAAQRWGDRHIKKGPSNSFSEDFDFVEALRCTILPPEIMAWFSRPEPRHWPSQEIIQAARQCSCFLVPDGYHGSEQKDIEWRITPNLIERKLMFTLNNIHIQCLVVLKSIKKEKFEKYIHHEECKITTFHCKTVLFITLEKTPSGMWTKPRLLECVVKCLETMLAFLSKSECPHYIVEGVDLFDGKLCRECQVCLEEAIKVMIQDDMHVLFHIQMDDLGRRLLEPSCKVGRGPGEDVNAHICGKLVRDMFQMYMIRLRNICFQLCTDSKGEFETRLINKITYLQSIETEVRDDHRKSFFIRFLLKNLLSTKASVVSSHYTQTGQPIPQEVLTMYEESLHTDVTSGKLKLASMLYCREELERAASMLHEVERDFEMSVQPVCGCGRSPYNEELSDAFCEYMLKNDDPEMWTKKLAFCVRFLREEEMCVPQFLWHEMNRAVEDDVDHRDCHDREWMDWAEVDARPFLLYLKYLTFRDLGDRDKQQKAFDSLKYIATSCEELNKLYHQETVRNVYGHCLELEGNVQQALRVYRHSQRYRPRNNAANHHIARLERDMNQLTVC